MTNLTAGVERVLCEINTRGGIHDDLRSVLNVLIQGWASWDGLDISAGRQV